MTSFITILIFSLILVSTCLAVKSTKCDGFTTQKLPEQCPEISYLRNVTFESLAGFYYQPYSTVNLTEVGCDSACVTTRISAKDENAYKIEFCCRKGCGIQCGAKVGSGTLTYHPTVVSSFLYTFVDTCGRPSKLQLFILDSDNFESYFIAYGCEGNAFNGPKKDHVIVATKNQNLTEDLIGHVFDVLSDNEVDTSRIIFNPQYKDCPYAFHD